MAADHTALNGVLVNIIGNDLWRLPLLSSSIDAFRLYSREHAMHRLTRRLMIDNALVKAVPEAIARSELIETTARLENATPHFFYPFESDIQVEAAAERLQAPILIIGPQRCISCGSILKETNLNSGKVPPEVPQLAPPQFNIKARTPPLCPFQFSLL